MATLRTPEGHKKYREYQKAHPVSDSCPLCDKEALKDFKFWKIIENMFPYDTIASVHHMLVPKRHSNEKELNKDEMEEISIIKESTLNPDYDWLIEATHKNKSIPGHFHIHLIVAK